MNQENKMGVMPVRKLLISMAWPAIISMTIQALYNVVDSLFVSYIGEKALTAVTLVYPMQMLIIAFAVGTGVGINSLISRKLGEKQFDKANLAASNGFKLSFINWALFAIIGIFFAEDFVSLFTNDPYIIEQSASFLAITNIFSIFIIGQITLEKILQSTGNMIMPMMSTVTGAVINALLAPVFIFGLFGVPRLEVTGAAIATVIAQGCAMIFVTILAVKKNKVVKISLKGKIFNGETLKEIYAVGAPTIVMQAILSVTSFGMNMILSSFSSTAVAVMGVYNRLQAFIFMPVFGINQGAMPVFGYNYGARNKERMIKAFKTAVVMALIIMTIGIALFQTLPHALLSMFNASEEMYEIGIPALRIISICFWPAAFGIISAGLFGATGHGVASLIGSLIRQLVGILPLAWILAKFGDVTMVWWAFPIAEILSIIYFVLVIRNFNNKEIKTMEKLEHTHTYS